MPVEMEKKYIPHLIQKQVYVDKVRKKPSVKTAYNCVKLI